MANLMSACIQRCRTKSKSQVLWILTEAMRASLVYLVVVMKISERNVEFVGGKQRHLMMCKERKSNKIIGVVMSGDKGCDRL